MNVNNFLNYLYAYKAFAGNKEFQNYSANSESSSEEENVISDPENAGPSEPVVEDPTDNVEQNPK